MLKTENLIKKYGNLTVVNDISIDIHKSEIVSITGRSGAGKSTLLHLIGGLDKPDSGKVFLNGVDVLTLGARKQARFRNTQMGFVFQFHHLLPEFSAIENVAMPLWISGMSRKAAVEKSAEILSVVGLYGKLNNKPSELSGGEQQRVAIARALVNNPSVIFADEPTGNLDSGNAKSINQLFLDLREKFGQTFVIVTHNEILSSMTDRTFVMQDGKIVDEHKNIRS